MDGSISPENHVDVHVEELCSCCQTIDFSNLRLSLVSEIVDTEENGTRTRSSLAQTTSRCRANLPAVDIGSYSRVLRNEANCALCNLWGSILLNDERSPIYGTESIDTIKGDLDGNCHVSYGVGIICSGLTDSGIISMNLDLNWFQDPIPLGVPPAVEACFQTSDQSASISSDLASSNAALLYGGRFRPLQIDVTLVKSWIEICDSQHGGKCASTVSIQRPNIACRLIDVYKRCIIEIESSKLHEFNYATLSYVWGGKQHKLDLRTSNIEALKEPFALSNKMLSPILADFLDFVFKIDVGYAWVDALCILQDNDVDKALQISQMSQIYNLASLTIINAGGNDLDSGLPGLQPSTRKASQKQITIRYSTDNNNTVSPAYVTLLTSLTPATPNKSKIQTSRWYSRAWTYQERLVSRRALVFAKEQIFWACNQAAFCEETYQEIPQDNIYYQHQDDTLQEQFMQNAKVNRKRIGRDSAWYNYASYVKNYSSRNLTFNGDIHDAFVGIADAITQKLGSKILWGLPVMRFEPALTWDSNDPGTIIKRRLDQSSLGYPPEMRNITFPSWSWMGWVGEVKMRIHGEWVEDGHEFKDKCHIHSTNPLKIYPIALMDIELDYEDGDYDFIVSLREVQEQYPLLTRQELEKTPDSTLLFFRSEVGFLHVQYPEVSPAALLNLRGERFQSDKHIGKPSVIDEDGHEIGNLEVTDPQLDLEDGEYEFAVVGRQFLGSELAEQVHNAKAKVMVLQLGRRDEIGMPEERVSFGMIYEDAWNRCARSKRERVVVLQ